MPELPFPQYTYNKHRGDKPYRLSNPFEFSTGITGHTASIYRATLAYDGTLYVYGGFEWNLGNWPAINTPAMVVGSLGHDPVVEMVNTGLLPESVRPEIDSFFREELNRYSTGLEKHWRWGRWIGVRINGEYRRARRWLRSLWQ